MEPLLLPGVAQNVSKFICKTAQERGSGLAIHQWFQLQLVESSNCPGDHCISGICRPQHQLLHWLRSDFLQRYPQLSHPIQGSCPCTKGSRSNHWAFYPLSNHWAPGERGDQCGSMTAWRWSWWLLGEAAHILNAQEAMKPCCNFSGGFVLIVWFVMNGMYMKNNTIIYVARASNSERDCEHNLFCCLLPWCDAWRTCHSGFPIVTKWCSDQDGEVVLSSAFTQRMCDRCDSLQKGGDVVATSPVVLRLLCDSLRTGCAWRITPLLYIVWASNSKRDWKHDLYCCLLPQCEALRTCHSGFPIATTPACQQTYNSGIPCF